MKYVIEIADKDVPNLNWIKVDKIFITDHSSPYSIEILSVEQVDAE